jgi:hypothetical protein
MQSISFDDSDIKSIRAAEKKKAMLENKGYNLVKTTQRGFDKWNMVYEEGIVNNSQGTVYDILNKVVDNRSQIRIPLGEKYVGIEKIRTGEISITSLLGDEVGISIWIAEQKPISIDKKSMGITKIIKNRTYVRSVRTKTLKDNTARFIGELMSNGKIMVRN